MGIEEKNIVKSQGDERCWSANDEINEVTTGGQRIFMTLWIRLFYSSELSTVLGFYMKEATQCGDGFFLFLSLLEQAIQCFNLIYFILIFSCPQARVLLRGAGVKLSDKMK